MGIDLTGMGINANKVLDRLNGKGFNEGGTTNS